MMSIKQVETQTHTIQWRILHKTFLSAFNQTHKKDIYTTASTQATITQNYMQTSIL